MMDESDLSIQGFDRLRDDADYAAAIEVRAGELMSSYR
jgi:hypothetical protein